MEIAKEGKNITSLMEWRRSKKMIYVFAIMLGVLANYGTNFAMTSIGSNMAATLGSPQLFSLIFTLPMFFMTLVQPAANWLGEKFGIGKILVASQALMLVQCVMILLAPSVEVVIVARSFGNIANAFLMAVGVGAYALMFKPDECSKWNGVFGTTISLAICIFPFLSGVLLDITSMWQPVFIVVTVISALGLVLSCLSIPPRSAEPKTEAPFDFAGLLAMGVCTIAFLYLVTFGGTQFPWLSVVSLVLIVAAIAGGVAFVKIEGKKGDEALVPLRVFKNRPFVMALVAGMLLFPDVILVTYLPTYGQTVLGQSATNASLFSSAPGLLAVFASTAFGVLLEKKGCFKGLFAMSTILALVATIALFFFDAEMNFYLIVLFMTVTWGTAYSIFKFIPGAIVQAKVPAEDAPLCFNLVQLGLCIGSCFAAALAGLALMTFPNDMATAFNYCFAISCVGSILAWIVVTFGLKDEKKN